MAIRIHSLKQQKDFGRLFKKGKQITGKNLVLKIARNNLDISRFTVIISNKVSKHATVRNRIRRQLREIIRINLSNIKPGFDIVFFCSKGIVEETFQDMQEITDKLLQKAGLLEK